MLFSKPLNSRPGTPGSRQRFQRTMSLAGIMLLAFYAAITFPGYYEQGPCLQQWFIIGSVMLSAIVLFFFERTCSSREGRSKHDWNTSGGSLYAFSFGRFTCKKCSRKRILVSLNKQGRLYFFIPGKAAPEKDTVEFYCPCCKDSVGEADCKNASFSSSRIGTKEYAGLRKKLKHVTAYRLNKEYTRRYILVTFILFLAEISSFYLARDRAVMLLLPLCVGYFLFVSAHNMLTALVTKYYVTDTDVFQRILWGYSQYRISDHTTLVNFCGDGGEDAWGLYTERENLMISPIITEYSSMLDSIKAACLSNSAIIIDAPRREQPSRTKME